MTHPNRRRQLRRMRKTQRILREWNETIASLNAAFAAVGMAAHDFSAATAGLYALSNRPEDEI